MRLRARTDGNQEEIAQALEKAGCKVERRLARLGGGISDLLVWRKNRFYMLEVKQPGEKLTPKEQQWLSTFPANVVHTVEEAYKAVGVK
jgi:hypothetical protein